jgi:hypothetical protein
MKTTLVITLEHKDLLPADILDQIAGRIYTLQVLDQSADSVKIKKLAEFEEEKFMKQVTMYPIL